MCPSVKAVLVVKNVATAQKQTVIVSRVRTKEKLTDDEYH